MIFGRKARNGGTDDGVAVEQELLDDEAAPADDAGEASTDDPRADGPFDAEEVDLDADKVERLTFGPLIITPFEGLNLQLHGDPETNTIQALLAAYGDSGLELALFAAPRTGGLAAELREETIEETGQAGGHAEEADGPFGPEIRRVLPLEGPEGEQLFHVSRIWLVEGPRWLLRGTLMGRAGMVEGENEPADVFVEFFRNVVVDRDEQPRVPGELIHLSVPAGAPQG
ncbi:MAG: DUF3710 domain-containing protein [Propioniciclava sp.]|uniref:DUF3710 domain-containing protein n=1 Tax=Propioniciclava sp. TaxID=2038686 RepID=UPI0039E5027A